MTSTHVSMTHSEQRQAQKVGGRYEPGRVWHAPGKGVLWLDGEQGDIRTEDWLQWLKEVCAVHPVDCTDGMISLSETEFMEVMVRLAGAPEWRMSEGLALYARLQRLAAVMVLQRDVLAFAAPESNAFTDVVELCQSLAAAGEDGLGHWGSQDNVFRAAWIPAWTNPHRRALRALYRSVAGRIWSGWHAGLGWNLELHGQMVTEVWLWRCVNREMRRLHRESGLTGATAEPSGYRIPYRGEEEVMEQWKAALSGDDTTFTADSWLVWRTLKQAFQDSGWGEPTLNDPSGRAHYHLELDLIPPAKDATLPDWRLICYVTHNIWRVRAPLAEWFTVAERKWSVGRETLVHPDEWIFPQLRTMAQVCPAMERALATVHPFEASLPPDEVFAFLTVQVAELEERGVRIRYPDLELAKAADVRIRVQVKRLKGKGAGTGNQAHGGGWFDAQRLVEFDWTVAVGDAELSRQEFEQMVEQRTPFVQLQGSWRLIPIEAVLGQVEAFRSRSNSAGNLMQFTRAVLMSQDEGDNRIQLDVSFDESAWDAKQVMSALLHAHQPPLLTPPNGFRGSLRSYQQLGFSWLLHLRSIACGGVLADDMGLGKTIQVLAYLLYVREQGLAQGVHLLICPTSLLQNWRAEIIKFAPELRLHVHHGVTRNTPREDGTSPLEAALADSDIVMTTYATAVRDIDLLATCPWDVLIADEAQNVKNYETKQAQALRSLQAHHRVALTGTPIENRLEELWSIFQLTNPGYLGNLSWFRKMFVDTIAGGVDTQAMHRLHQLLRPVLLRRSKSDPEIQMELPEKWEVREYAGLTPEQAVLYQSVVNRLFDEIGGGMVGMSRRGQILTALVRLKQVCDHPCLALGGSANVSRSGKLKMLLDLMQGVVDEGDAALVFTQFRDMGELLCDAFSERFGWRPKFLHGGLSAVKRGDMVRDFQSGEDPSPVLVLSLKAGGVGLNLTRANHVFHYDRWWNPAVEDQATDRAFRIGQVRDVQVHKLVCPGTLEERIDALIQSKRMLSSAVVGESEGWITEMDNESLRALFELDADAAVEDDEV